MISGVLEDKGTISESYLTLKCYIYFVISTISVFFSTRKIEENIFWTYFCDKKGRRKTHSKTKIFLIITLLELLFYIKI